MCPTTKLGKVSTRKQHRFHCKRQSAVCDLLSQTRQPVHDAGRLCVESSCVTNGERQTANGNRTELQTSSLARLHSEGRGRLLPAPTPPVCPRHCLHYRRAALRPEQRYLLQAGAGPRRGGCRRAAQRHTAQTRHRGRHRRLVTRAQRCCRAHSTRGSPSTPAGPGSGTPTAAASARARLTLLLVFARNSSTLGSILSSLMVSKAGNREPTSHLASCQPLKPLASDSTTTPGPTDPLGGAHPAFTEHSHRNPVPASSAT